MNSTSLEQLGSVKYWEDRYKQSKDDRGVSHEWFRSYDSLRGTLSQHLLPPSRDPCIIHLGCGDSTLPVKLQDQGYRHQTCVDFSSTVIEQMKCRFPDLQWIVEDVRHMHLDDASFDIAIDKGTLDAMIHGSQWTPPDSVRSNIGQYVDEVIRILKPQGRWLYITYRQPHFVKMHLNRPQSWRLTHETLTEGGGSFEYFLYVMVKHEAAAQKEIVRSASAS